MKAAIAAVLQHWVKKDDENMIDRSVLSHQESQLGANTKKVKLMVQNLNVIESIFRNQYINWFVHFDQDCRMIVYWKNAYGCTQNVNEAFSAYVWKRAPKGIFVGKNDLDMLRLLL